MAVVESAKGRFFNKVAVAIVLLLTVVYLVPLYWIGSTAFKPRAAATTVPPTVFFKPELTPFIKLFTKRVQLRKVVSEEKYSAATWYEKLVYDAGERIITSSPFLSRFWNSIIIAGFSTILALTLGTLTAYGFSRFKLAGENDWLFFILSTRMLPPVVVAIPIFLMFRIVGLVDSRIGLILLYTALNLSFCVWLMKGFMDEIPV